MPLQIYRLRRLLAATAAILTLAVAGMYFYARSRVRNVLKEVPNKIGYDIKQTANGFQFSKSDGKRTLFSVQATDVKEFKLNGRAELHGVNIVLYGRDSSRYDQIYGDDFSYDQQTGDVKAKGEVQIDLVANPSGLASPDQSTPKELKNPIHLKTRDLVFNKETGDASTDARVDFRTPQATGWAIGVKYAGKTNSLTLSSQVHVQMMGASKTVLEAEHGIITNDPREIVLERAHLDREGVTARADRVVFFLGADNQIQRALATGNVSAETRAVGRKQAAQAASEIRGRADQAEFLLTETGNLLRNAILTGNVHAEQAGPQPIVGDAGRVILEFAEKRSGPNQLEKIHASDGARLTQRGAQTTGNRSAQNFELTAPIIDFTLADARFLERAVTSGAAQITITPTEDSQAEGQVPGERTVVTAGQFDAKFVPAQSANEPAQNRLSAVHGSPDARIVNSVPGQPDRISSSESVDAAFLERGGIESITQKGTVAYTDGLEPVKRTQAWADNARYTPADQMLVLTGSPRVTSGSMATTAKTIRINRATGDALAEGSVKSTYSELKEQPEGALLASSSPIHVTARSMTAHRDPGVALYTGNARLWQDANIVEAPSIQFDRDRRFVTAQGMPSQPAKTILVQTEKAQTEKAQEEKPQMEKVQTASDGQDASLPKGTTQGKNTVRGNPLGESSPIVITAMKLTYADAERKIHYEGGVSAKGIDFTATAKSADAFLLPRSQTMTNQSFVGAGQLDHMIAQDDVVIQQPHRRAEGQKLVYTAAADKFVLTGGPPSIFDAERGKITGVSLTFFRGDDRVLVEGETSTPVVTQTRVAR